MYSNLYYDRNYAQQLTKVVQKIPAKKIRSSTHCRCVLANEACKNGANIIQKFMVRPKRMVTASM